MTPLPSSSDSPKEKTPQVSIIYEIVRRYGAFRVTAASTIISVFLSAGMTAILDLLLKGSVPGSDILVGMIVPAILAPIMVHGFVRVSFQLGTAESQLRYIATHDHLTRCFNRGHLMGLAENEVARAKRYKHELAILMLDLDHFKRINDRFGHAVGDRVLKEVADCFKGCLRKTDILGRWGGEEFVILLPETKKSGAMLVADRLCKEVRKIKVDLDEKLVVTTTVSVGISAGDCAQMGLSELLGRADKALYRAKEAGRNRCELFETDGSLPTDSEILKQSS